MRPVVMRMERLLLVSYFTNIKAVLQPYLRGGNLHAFFHSHPPVSNLGLLVGAQPVCSPLLGSFHPSLRATCTCSLGLSSMHFHLCVM